jgi:hypothetical protein
VAGLRPVHYNDAEADAVLWWSQRFGAAVAGAGLRSRGLKVGYVVDTGAFELNRRMVVSLAIQDAFCSLGKNLLSDAEHALSTVSADAEDFPEYMAVIRDVLLRIALDSGRLEKAFELAYGTLMGGSGLREKSLLKLLENLVNTGGVDQLSLLSLAVKVTYTDSVNVSLKIGDMYKLLGHWREASFWLENAARLSVVAAALRKEIIVEVERHSIEEADMCRAQSYLAGMLVRNILSKGLWKDEDVQAGALLSSRAEEWVKLPFWHGEIYYPLLQSIRQGCRKFVFVGAATIYHAVQVSLMRADQMVFWGGISGTETFVHPFAEWSVDGGARVQLLDPFNASAIAETVCGGVLVCACEELVSYAIITKIVALDISKTTILVKIQSQEQEEWLWTHLALSHWLTPIRSVESDGRLPTLLAAKDENQWLFDKLVSGRGNRLWLYAVPR